MSVSKLLALICNYLLPFFMDSLYILLLDPLLKLGCVSLPLENTSYKRWRVSDPEVRQKWIKVFSNFASLT